MKAIVQIKFFLRFDCFNKQWMLLSGLNSICYFDKTGIKKRGWLKTHPRQQLFFKTIRQ